MTLAPEPTGRAGVWLRLALVVSLTVNLLVAGLLIGSWAGRDRAETTIQDVGLGPYIAALPQRDRQLMAASLAEKSRPLRENRAELARQFDLFLAALRTEPFRVDALRRAVDMQQAQLLARQQIGQSALFDRIAAMTPVERNAFADAVERRLRHGPRFRRDR